MPGARPTAGCLTHYLCEQLYGSEGFRLFQGELLEITWRRLGMTSNLHCLSSLFPCYNKNNVKQKERHEAVMCVPSLPLVQLDWQFCNPSCNKLDVLSCYHKNQKMYMLAVTYSSSLHTHYPSLSRPLQSQQHLSPVVANSEEGRRGLAEGMGPGRLD